MDAPWFEGALGVLATWRLTQLLVRDDGPWDLVFKLRVAAGDGAFGRMLDCFHCCSLCCAAAVALAIARGPLEWVLMWWALSGAACLIDRLGQAPLVLKPLPDEGAKDELLRSEAGGLDGQPGQAGDGEGAGGADGRRADGQSLHIVR